MMIFIINVKNKTSNQNKNKKTHFLSISTNLLNFKMNRGPTLTVKQERSTLSARKKQVKNLKNILAQPFPRFW